MQPTYRQSRHSMGGKINDHQKQVENLWWRNLVEEFNA